MVVFEKERDDVDANIAVLGSDGRDPLSSGATFILLWCWCSSSGARVRVCVYLF